MELKFTTFRAFAQLFIGDRLTVLECVPAGFTAVLIRRHNPISSFAELLDIEGFLMLFKNVLYFIRKAIGFGNGLTA
jgi:hypothetical protein